MLHCFQSRPNLDPVPVVVSEAWRDMFQQRDSEALLLSADRFLSFVALSRNSYCSGWLNPFGAW